MSKKIYNTSIFIFRRDLRLYDNIGLINSLKDSISVIPIFIFTKEQVINNDFKSNNAIQFMVKSLEDVNIDLKKFNSKIHYLYGNYLAILKNILKETKIDAIYLNKDYTPYSIERDNNIKTLCKNNNIEYKEFEDILLNPIGSIRNISGETFTKFTPYFNKAKLVKISEPLNNKLNNYKKIKFKFNNKEYKKFFNINDNILVEGGRSNGLKILDNIKNFKLYNEKRNDLTYNTTHLSAYIKFGCLSIREIYHSIKSKLGSSNDLIKQLYWRDFYYNIAFYNQQVFGGALKEKYNIIKWDNNKNNFEKWTNGLTGFPIIDAAMREINSSGFMHNRARLIVASFLVKILLIDWQWGEKYFAQRLVDYDPCVNNGNWQWVAGTGADAQPYFRIFNPWSQTKSYDPECKYIKKWLPELNNVPSKHIIEWDKYCDQYKNVNYPKPIVDYKKQREKAIKVYSQVFK